ncbi:MAG: glycosyltransferase [Thermodesulfobacteriota bacterium]|nr:MAG: glycosyltransferase [Thermodesulfobacteriota bacterium]
MSTLNIFLTIAAGVSAAVWIYFLLFRGRFWRCAERLDKHLEEPARWPVVTAVIPARNEGPIIESTLTTLFDQDYPGELHIILVNDESSDDTAAAALKAAKASGADRFHMEFTGERPGGWVGKMWALNTGVRAAKVLVPETKYLLFTDADIAHSTGNLRDLVKKAESQGLDLVSLMVLLQCGQGWTRLLIPAFVYFFQKVYPFSWVNNARRGTAAAAGGCMLVRKNALEFAGGLEKIKDEIIDDCALARVIKRGGPIWLGLTTTERSVRPYAGLKEIWDMVARTAYTELNHSPGVLFATLAGMFLFYLLPPLAFLLWPLHGNTPAMLLGGAGWFMSALTFMPVLALYGRSRLLAPFLPLAALLYGAMTFDSARRHAKGTGALWKGRVGAGSIDA